MKMFLSILLTAFLFSTAYADDVKVEAMIAVDADTKPAETFAPGTAKLNAFFRSSGTKAGDVLRGVLIAEDVGAVAPANTKVLETSLTADKENFFGAFTFSKPAKGWPVGKYRVEIYLKDAVVATAKFAVVAEK